MGTVEELSDTDECQTPLYYKNTGNKYFADAKYEDALKYYLRGIDIAPHKQLVTKNPMEAMNDKTVSKAETLSDDSTQFLITSQLYGNAGASYIQLNKLNEAIDSLSEAIKHNQSYGKAYLRRANCYYTINKYNEAYADYQKFEELGCKLDNESSQKRNYCKTKVDEDMGKMMSDLKDLGNKFFGKFGLSTDNFKLEKNNESGGYSVQFNQTK